AWWTDPIGRRHWHLELNDPVEGSPQPLAWIAPPLSCGWRERGGVRDFVVICRCGFADSPESLKWMGDCCGPCFDRGQEGLPPLGRPVARPVANAADTVRVV